MSFEYTFCTILFFSFEHNVLLFRCILNYNFRTLKCNKYLNTMLQGVEIFGIFNIFTIFTTFFRVQDRLNSTFWWLITSVVAFEFLPDILRRWWGPMNDIFSFFECWLSGGDT